MRTADNSAAATARRYAVAEKKKNADKNRPAAKANYAAVKKMLEEVSA